MKIKKIESMESMFIPFSLNIKFDSEEEAKAFFVIFNYTPIHNFLDRHCICLNPAFDSASKEIADAVYSGPYYDLHSELNDKLKIR